MRCLAPEPSGLRRVALERFIFAFHSPLDSIVIRCEVLVKRIYFLSAGPTGEGVNQESVGAKKKEGEALASPSKRRVLGLIFRHDAQPFQAKLGTCGRTPDLCTAFTIPNRFPPRTGSSMLKPFLFNQPGAGLAGIS